MTTTTDSMNNADNTYNTKDTDGINEMNNIDPARNTDSTAENQITSKTYETAVAELEGILTQLENHQLPLEDAIKQFESGVALVKHCQGILDATEQKIKGLSNSCAD